MSTTQTQTQSLQTKTNMELQKSPENQKYLYLAGIHVTHSIARPVHNHIASTLSLPWTFINQECPTIESVLALFRAPTFAGGVVTMPYKKTVMSHLDELDDLAVKIGACNNVYKTKEGKLRGTNTDWRGIKGCLIEGCGDGSVSEGKGKPALIVGAGGASRAAVFALWGELGCGEIYVVNRDQQEVKDLMEDVKSYVSSGRELKLRHITEVKQAEDLPAPFFIVGTVPDFEAKTEEEIKARDILKTFLNNSDEKGVLLDMCFKPRNTRILKLARASGWRTVDGTGVIGYQFEEQWRLWSGAGEDGKPEIPKKEASELLKKYAEESTAINF